MEGITILRPLYCHIDFTLVDEQGTKWKFGGQTLAFLVQIGQKLLRHLVQTRLVVMGGWLLSKLAWWFHFYHKVLTEIFSMQYTNWKTVCITEFKMAAGLKNVSKFRAVEL